MEYKMTDSYETKYEEMQKYVPFIQKVIEKLKINNDHQADNPRKAQLQKMEMLHDLLTNKQKKIKMETLMKCEGVLVKLQAKIEKQATALQSEDSILNEIKMKHQTATTTSATGTSKNKTTEDDILGPASPPPEIILIDDINPPVVIPTERRCSPILVKGSEKDSSDKPQQQHNIETLDRTKQLHDATKNNLDSKSNNTKMLSSAMEAIASQNKNNTFQRNTHHSSFKSITTHDHNHGKDPQHHKHSKQPSSQLSKERLAEVKKSPATEQKLQTVKVVITEPLPVHFKQQHFPPTSTFLPRSSVCCDNLKSVRKTSDKKREISEAYSPEESWDQFNDSKNKKPSAGAAAAAAIFSRLGDKVSEEMSKSKASGRYTPIPDVLKSPPLSVTDINNLLLESGSEKTFDISEIGTRRPPKIEEEPKNSFEFVRKKLAQTAKFHSPLTDKDKRNISPLPHERIALKYNPHPRQERLPSVSSTDSSECGTQSNANNSRINPKLPASIPQRSPSQVAASNVNVLPAINLSDPRLKRQTTPLATTTPDRKSMLPTPPAFTSPQTAAFPNQNSLIFCRRKDPRISRVTNNVAPASLPTALPFQRMTTEPPGSHEDEEKTKKLEKRYERVDSFERPQHDDRNMSPSVRDKLPKTALETETSATKHQSNASLKPDPQNEQSLSKKAKAKNKSLPNVTYVVPNAPKSDTEEDWDAEPQTRNVKAKPSNTDLKQTPLNISSVVPGTSPYHSQISPQAVVSPKPPALLAHNKPHISQMPSLQQPFPKPGPNTHHSYRPHNPQSSCNRFNSLLNDTTERAKYFEAKKQKSVEPRTYKEFREAKERALAQEAALKSAAEAKKRSNELKASQTMEAGKIQNANEQKTKQFDAFNKKPDDYKKEKKALHKDAKKPSAGESTLDKMYRTQNFNTSFPKANTSFKIPKKKTEENSKKETTTSKEAAADQTKALTNPKKEQGSKTMPSADNATVKIKTDRQQKDGKKLAKTSTKANPSKIETSQRDVKLNDEERDLQATTEEVSSQKTLSENSKPDMDSKTEDKQDGGKKDEIVSGEKDDVKEDNQEEHKEPKKSIQETDTTAEGSQLNVRDPRCRPKTTSHTPATTNDASTETPEEASTKTLADIIITSSENQVILKPQQNLEKFNQLSQQVSPQPQRILRRRNTMLVFDSAPLVDKEKLRKANALLFEDVHDEEKRKRKQAEEDKLIARRNKNLEEMFKKTDDNCTVSTQNIITGKRRTRATINFNETANAINVFKHLTIKEGATANGTSAATLAPAAKPVRSNFKIKIKNLAHVDRQKDDDSDDDKPLQRLAKREAKLSSLKQKDSSDSKAKAIKKETHLNEDKSDESENESKINIKSTKKRTSVNKKLAEDKEQKFTPLQNEEHQNCAVSSTSTDNYNVEENTCSSTSTHKSDNRKETDDNEPTSTATKSNNPTPTPEPNEPILREIVDQILKPNANREPILDILSQILSEDKLALIKCLIESNNKPTTDESTTKEADMESEGTETPKPDRQTKKNIIAKKEKAEDQKEEEEEPEEQKPIVSHRAAGESKKSATIPKKKRSELDRLNEDIRDMFICNGVLTATGRRMCTIMGKDVPSTSGKDSSKESTPSPSIKSENSSSKKKPDILKPPTTARSLRRSTRSCKAIDDNEDNESIVSRTTEDSIDSIADSVGTDVTPIRKMPVLKPHTPIKIIGEVTPKSPKPNAAGQKRKSDSTTLKGKVKKPKTKKDDSKQDSDLDEKNNSEPEADNKADDEQREQPNILITNTNLHWHNQSKYTAFCMICDKRVPACSSSVHYKTHHRENYISRMAPVLLQQYKQGKLSKPLFGVKRAQKQPTWFHRCPFCLKYFNTALPLWLEHFQNHTAEFRYECSKCFRSSNKKLTITRHIKHCAGATVLTSAVKLNVPTIINAHVCHLCNFLQLKRENLERHYIEQHQLQKKTVDLLGYTIKMFDVADVEFVSEQKAAEKETEVWKSIEKNEQVIDIEDDDAAAAAAAANKAIIVDQIKDPASEQTNETEQNNDVANEESVEVKTNIKQQTKIIEEADEGNTSDKAGLNLQKSPEQKEPDKTLDIQEGTSKEQKKKTKAKVISQSNENQGNDFEMVDQQVTAQDIQDELLALAAKAAENAADESNLPPECKQPDASTFSNEQQQEAAEPLTTMSDIISSSINMIYGKKNDESSEQPPKTAAQAVASNVFMPTRDDTNYSPTIQILAQSIINIDEAANQSVKEKPITMAERLSQRFKDLQNENAAPELILNSSSKPSSNENAFEKLIDDTLLELTKEKDSANQNLNNRTATATSANAECSGTENVFDKLFNATVLELEKDDLHDLTENEQRLMQTQETANADKDAPPTDSISIISDDEDWEDIEITETAPTVTTLASGSNMQKSKNKGLFQKFGMFKNSNTKSKKHLSPMVFLPKKKAKEKSSSATTAVSAQSPITTTTTTTTGTATATSTSKPNEITNSSAAISSSSHTTNLGFKPVISIMDGLFPDSPSNDPIDLVPELAPLEPLQDLNDISSILDSNLSAVNINAADNHTSIEDALDFISEQQANDKQKSNPSSSDFVITANQGKTTTINNISHVGFSVQNAAENSFKFYCLLQNCSFLYSSDSIGLESHFMCEHSEIKWNGYCLMCQAQCFAIDGDASGVYPISREIRHMMEKHAKNSTLDLNTDSTQHSSSSNQETSEGRPKIKLRRLTGDCLSRATPENVVPSIDIATASVPISAPPPLTMLGALLVADPKPPTKEMPPQPQMPLTEPLLLETNTDTSSQLPFRNLNSDFLITSVTSAGPQQKQPSLQISNVVSLNNEAAASSATPAESAQMQIPKISNVRTLAPKAGLLWSQQNENDRLELTDAAAESAEVSFILQNASNPAASRENTRPENDSPVLVAETVPIAQSKTGDFVVTQTLSAQYNEFSSTALGFNISIAATTATENITDTSPSLSASCPNSGSVASRQYKCMGSGCKFVSRVPVAMSDHLRFHERRNFSNKQDYLSCGFCFYCASDVDDYMKHANQFHIINKSLTALSGATANESDTATSLTKKIHNILNSKTGSSGPNRYSNQSRPPNQTKQAQDSQEVYIKKLKTTIEEIVAPTGLPDHKLYRCVVKNCQSQLTESTFLNHIMFHITTNGGNPNNYLYKCPHCSAQYHRPAGIKAHIKNHARNRYFCYLCDETSTNPGQLLKHFSEKHWHTLNMYTKELLPAKPSSDDTDSNYYVAYTHDLSPDEVRKFGEKLILEWLRKKSGSKTHFKSSEIDLLPLSAIFQRQVNCGECEYKTKVRTNMFRHLLMHQQNPGLAKEIGAASVMVDPVNPVPCLNSNERFFDKMTNLASSSLIPSSSAAAAATTKPTFNLPQTYVEESKRYVCGCAGCNYHTISDDLLRTHLSALHSSELTYTCPFCKEEVCKRGISIDRIINHTRFHGITIYRCDECNYYHHLRYVVERHINEKHSTLKLNIVTHVRSMENSGNGTTTSTSFAAKKYNPLENKSTQQPNALAARSTNNDSSAPKPTATATPVGNVKGKGRWECDVCGHKSYTVGQIQTHCQQQHSVKTQYKCVHCNFGSQQLSQILHHIDEIHAGKTREACTMYHKIFNGNNEEVADTRPLWQRNDPTRVRHIRGILMEDEEESEEYRKKLALTEDVDDDSNEEHPGATDEIEELNAKTYISGYEFACYHCSFKTPTFEDLKERHYAQNHNCKLETAKPFWYRLHRRLCCPECRSFVGNYNTLQQHLQNNHKKRFYAADIKMAEYDDNTQRILCGYCSFHGLNADQLYRHHLRAQHWPQDIRLDNNEQIMEILALGKSEVSYQCTLCADIYPNQVAMVQHACNSHAGEESFAYRELSNSLIYRCNSCCFTSTVEMELLKHTIDHYSRFKVCSFCQEAQTSFNAYMQHCYAEHKTKIEKFRTIYPFLEIKKFLLQTLVVFPSGLVLNKRNLLNTQYGRTYIIDELYEEICRISQQPPIPRLSIARLVARKSIEAQQKNMDNSPSDDFKALLSRPKTISARRCTVAFDVKGGGDSSSSQLKPKDGKQQPAVMKRRITNDDDQQAQKQVKHEEFSAPLKANKISKRRRTVAVDRDTLFSSNLKSSSNLLLTEWSAAGDRKRKGSLSQAHTHSPKHIKEVHPLNLDMEPFSYYGMTPENVDLSKIYTKVAIGGIKTPLTIDKFKLLFNIDCQLKLTKCDEDDQLFPYKDYKHIRKACPASEKLKYD